MTVLDRQFTYDTDGVCDGSWVLSKLEDVLSEEKFIVRHSPLSIIGTSSDCIQSFVNLKEARANFKERRDFPSPLEVTVRSVYVQEIKHLQVRIAYKMDMAQGAGVDMIALHRETDQ